MYPVQMPSLSLYSETQPGAEFKLTFAVLPAKPFEGALSMLERQRIRQQPMQQIDAGAHIVQIDRLAGCMDKTTRD